MVTVRSSLPAPRSGTLPGSLFTQDTKTGLLANTWSPPDKPVLSLALEPPQHVCWAVSLQGAVAGRRPCPWLQWWLGAFSQMPCLSYLEQFVSSWAAGRVLGLLSVIFSAPEGAEVGCRVLAGKGSCKNLVPACPHGVLLPTYTWAPFHLGVSPLPGQLSTVPWKMANPALLVSAHVPAQCGVWGFTPGGFISLFEDPRLPPVACSTPACNR